MTRRLMLLARIAIQKASAIKVQSVLCHTITCENMYTGL